MRALSRTAVCWAGLATAAAAGAQAPPAMPSAQVLEQRARSLDLRLPAEAELQRAAPVLPDVDALPALPALPPGTPPGSPPDLEDLARHFERMQAGSLPGPARRGAAADPAASGLLVLVSLSMPVASLEALVADAERAGALLVLRGVQASSLRATRARLQQLVGQRQVAWRIDPMLFRTLQVQAVPTYVLLDPDSAVPAPCPTADDTAGQCRPPAHTRVAGDVTMQRALQAMADGGGPGVAPRATAVLRRLQERRP